MKHACHGYTASLTRGVRPWQLADDAATYGTDAGRWIIVATDGETEIPGGPYDTESECWAAIEAMETQAA